MKIFVKVKPLAKEEKVEKVDENNFVISVKEPTKENRANEAVIQVLAKHFGIAKSRLQIVSGKTSRHKIIAIS